MKSTANPMQRAHAAPRCTAMSKRSGHRCRAPAVRGWSVCRMHGARGGAPEGANHPNYKHGVKTKRMQNAMRSNRRLLKWLEENGY